MIAKSHKRLYLNFFENFVSHEESIFPVYMLYLQTNNGRIAAGAGVY